MTFTTGDKAFTSTSPNPINNLEKEDFLKLWKERKFCEGCGYKYSGCIIPQTGRLCPIYSRLVDLGINPVEEWIKEGVCNECNFRENSCKIGNNGRFCVIYEWLKKKNIPEQHSTKIGTNANSTIDDGQGGCQEVAKDNINLTTDIVNQSGGNGNSINEKKQNNTPLDDNSSTLEQIVNQSEAVETTNNGKKRKKVKVSIAGDKPLAHRLTNRQYSEENKHQQLPKGQATLDPFQFINKLDETDIRILRLINSGHCQVQIAKILRMSRNAVSKRIKKLLKYGFLTEVKDTTIIDRRVKVYKLTIPNIAEITSKIVNHESRGIDSRVEWGYFRLHGFQRRYSLSPGLLNLLLGNIDALRKVRGFKKVGSRPNWKFVIIERDGFKWEIRPRSIGVSISEDSEFYWIPFSEFNWKRPPKDEKRSLKDKLRSEIDQKTKELINEIEEKTGIYLEYKSDGWSHEPELAFLDGDGVIRKIAEEYGKIVIEGLGRIDASTGEPELEFEGNEKRDACETGEAFKDALISVGKLANGELPEPLKETIKETVMEATILGGSRTVQHQINELFSLVVKVMQRQDELTEKFLEALNNLTKS